MGIIPLGTGGNDLSRSLNWGGLYEEDKPLQKVILDITKAQIVYIDRWSLNMTLNSELSPKYNHAHDKLVSLSINYTVSQEFPDSVKNMILLKNLQF